MTLEIYRCVSPLSADGPIGDSRSVVSKALCSSTVQDRVASIGAEKLRDISKSLGILKADSSGVLLALSDMAHACLSDARPAG